ncbi:MAG: aldo/keto reductase [Candidatus Izimaplasma sp.]|nr:aldo/keto reductase [Candidatus Izimaplasma bacterium]
MDYKRLKRFNKKISRIGFGAWQLGNTKEFSDMTKEEGLKLVKKAIDKGITFFDTAPNYAQGRSEEILGEALKGYEDTVFINTKVGHDHEGNTDFSLPAITNSINRSLKVLNRSYLDSVILHNPSHDILRGETTHYKQLEELKKQGLIKGYGVSIDTPEEIEMVLKNSNVDTIELMFNIIHQSPKALFDKIKERDILLVIKVPLDSGWLTGKYDETATFTGIRSRWSKKDIETRSEIIDDIKSIVKEDNLVPIAISFILSFDAVTTVIPGVRNEKQLNSNVAAGDYELTDDLKQQLVKLYEEKIKDLDTPW